MAAQSSPPWYRRRLVLATLATIGVLAMLGTVAAGLLGPFLLPKLQDSAAVDHPPPVTSTVPPAPIAHVDVRTVVGANGVRGPEDCPPAPPAPPPPTEPFEACDVTKGAVYKLGPTVLNLGLTSVQSVKLPTEESYSVQVVIDGPSSAAFGKYTTAHVGEQIAFMRNGVVVSAPKITQPINAPSIALSGELTQPQADQIAAMLRDQV